MTTKKPDPNPNMELWESWEKTPPSWTKKVKYGSREFTTTCAQQQIKLGTKEWGPHGVKWGIRNSVYTPMQNSAGEIVSMLFEAEFWFPGGAFDIASDMTFNKQPKDKPVGIFPGASGDDWAKKLRTDARSKALSLLGMNADIFLGLYDDNKYVAQMRAEENGNAAPSPVVDPRTLAAAADIPWDEPAPPPAPPAPELVTEDQLHNIRVYMPAPFGDATLTEERLGKTYAMYGVTDVTMLTRRQAANVLLACKKLTEEGQTNGV